MHEGFAAMRENLLNELKMLAAKNNSLSPEEVSRRENILRELDMVEKNVEREIRDVEEKL